MRNFIHWQSELKTVTNNTTGITRYYIRICDVWRRVSMADYVSRDNDAMRHDSFITRTNDNLVHQYKTVYGVA